ncbi:low affinity iron permease family protein [Paucibacter sp. R3-3]|uniref:Low affinity iron permease family protein n=1 Tax=Roseateles agri TaxID=3098619 RepID=A0ABU5DMQ2_9BURK|nr:low affinity iron permease family protein [Paucibacter sp. R3-3]MDY0747572.1 low affinity iron permease family protein [Paucibacter sp. R3-3]
MVSDTAAFTETTAAEDPDVLGSMPSTNTASYARHSSVLTLFDRFSARVTRWAGSPLAFTGALVCVLLWAAVGHMFKYSENWQLVINTGTTIVTFLMVFLIQQGQNKDSVALHLKLNELLAANKQASNRMIGIEDLDEQDLRDVAAFYVRLSERAKKTGAQKESHSIDDEGMPTDAHDATVSVPATV